jgi:hypothetical protein
VRVCALVSTYNEERFIEGCLRHLVGEGIDVYLIDNSSTDRTVELAKRWLGQGLLGIESLPHDGTFRQGQLLQRKEELAHTLDADWFVHTDADERRSAARPTWTLREAITAADEAGFNAVPFLEFTFVPTREAPDHDHTRYEETMRWYYHFAREPLHHLKAWKKQPAQVDLRSSGGHQVAFPGRRVAPEAQIMRHYLFLSREHAARKWGVRFDPAETRRGMSADRAFVAPSRIRLPHRDELEEWRPGSPLDASRPHPRHATLESSLSWRRRQRHRLRDARLALATRRCLILRILARPRYYTRRVVRALPMGRKG